jgi:hypothetical protein
LLVDPGGGVVYYLNQLVVDLDLIVMVFQGVTKKLKEVLTAMSSNPGVEIFLYA